MRGIYKVPTYSPNTRNDVKYGLNELACEKIVGGQWIGRYDIELLSNPGCWWHAVLCCVLVRKCCQLLAYLKVIQSNYSDSEKMFFFFLMDNAIFHPLHCNLWNTIMKSKCHGKFYSYVWCRTRSNNKKEYWLYMCKAVVYGRHR